MLLMFKCKMNHFDVNHLGLIVLTFSNTLFNVFLHFIVLFRSRSRSISKGLARLNFVQLCDNSTKVDHIS